MKLELPPSIATKLKPYLANNEVGFTPRVLIAQVAPGTWEAPEKVWLIVGTITAETGRKVAKLVATDKAKL